MSPVAQLDVPVGDVQKMLPTLVRLIRDRDVHEWTPPRPLWFLNEVHAGLMRQAVALLRVAGDAGANDVLPSRLPPAVAWQNVVEIEHLPLQSLAAVLTSVLVALEDVVAGELHLLLRKPLEKQQNNDAWHPHVHGDRLHHLTIGVALGKILPAFEVVREEASLAFCRDRLRMSLIEKSERTPRAARIHSLPEAIQNQNRSI